MRLTPKEKLIIQAILDSEYGDGPTDDVWTTYLAENAGLNRRSMGGIVNSLVKKRLARTGVCEGMGSGFGDMDTLGLTPEGVEAALAAGLSSDKTEGIVYTVSRFSPDRPYRVTVEYRSWVEGKDEYQVFETLSEARARETELNRIQDVPVEPASGGDPNKLMRELEAQRTETNTEGHAEGKGS